MKALPVALLLVVNASPALAQSLPLVPHVYAGLEGGPGSRASVDGDGTGHGHDHGLDYGAFAGLELPTGGLPYFAAEAEIGSTTGHVRTSAIIDDAEHISKADPKWNWAATARLGVKPLPGLAAYGIAGYGGERVKVSATDEDGTVSDSGWLKGIVYGVGARYALGSTLLRLEYRHRVTDGRYDPDQLLGGVAFRF